MSRHRSPESRFGPFFLAAIGFAAVWTTALTAVAVALAR